MKNLVGKRVIVIYEEDGNEVRAPARLIGITDHMLGLNFGRETLWIGQSRVKQIKRAQFHDHERPGFWEQVWNYLRA